MPRGSAYVGGVGWVKKQVSESANYDNLGEGWIFLISFFRWFPDALMDLCRSDEADYELTLIQRVMYRAKARNQYCDITGCRGLTKSYCSIGEESCEMILYPRISTAYFGPSFKQTAKIGSNTWKQLQNDYPTLTNHFVIASDGMDRFEVKTQYNSSLAITAFRGNNSHKVVAEESAQEENPRFDYDDYKRVVLPAVRLPYMINGKVDKTYIRFKQHSITSAGRRQSNAYETRCRHKQMMMRGESAFVIDISYEVLLLSQMRPCTWAEGLKNELTPDEWAREMESRYTGADSNPVVNDSTLTDCRSLLTMEEHHCCKDYGNKLNPKDVFYIVAYDVSYADGANNAKCACVVIKCTKQTEWLKRDKYLKKVVWVNDWSPESSTKQARRLKQVWARFSCEGSTAYIAIDAWQYGSSVLESLFLDLDDGLAPLCTVGHTMYTELELENAVQCIYPIKAGGVGFTDPDSEMIRNAELQFENRNVQLLTSNYGAGMEAYKSLHHIKDDRNDYAIYVPYKKTNELCGQIQNLKKVPYAGGVSEKRISKQIQRDSWSALKYGLRVAQKLERQYLMKSKKTSEWDAEFKKFDKKPNLVTGTASRSRLVINRRGGRIV